MTMFPPLETLLPNELSYILYRDLFDIATQSRSIVIIHLHQ